jgi:peptidoglycan/xylan/chitin deacetylase (PgdA/CDA1 family)
MKHKLVVFSGEFAYSVCKGIVELDRRIDGAQWLLIRHSPSRTLSDLMRSQWRNVRKHGWHWLIYQATHFASDLRRIVGRSHPSDDVAGPGIEYQLSRILLRPNVRLLDVHDINGADVVEHVRTFAPDLGVSLAAPILRPPLFEVPRLGTINLHKGRVPEYRGMPPAFWELWNDEAEVGCTVHRVAAGLDTGEVVDQAIVARRRFSTLRALQLELDEVGIDLTCRAVASILAGSARTFPQKPGGKTYRKPTLRQVAQLDARQRAAQPERPSALYRWTKACYLWGRLHTGRAWFALFAPSPTVTVILYHRVNDDLRDSLTTGIEQFDRQMALVRKHCTPVSIEQIVANELPRRADKPLVCVTFDDGYCDNYSNAVPLLLRHQIPCAFFVSTGFIDTSRQFPHDEGKVRMPLATMTWEQLRRMRDDGFVVGSHTVNHVNCAAADAAVVQKELCDSLRQLREKLKLREVILAYPFGGREHMTPERLELVKDAGYSGCLSAYGGFNRGAINKFNVLRCGVNWGFSDLAFRCRIWGIN